MQDTPVHPVSFSIRSVIIVFQRKTEKNHEIDRSIMVSQPAVHGAVFQIRRTFAQKRYIKALSHRAVNREISKWELAGPEDN